MFYRVPITERIPHVNALICFVTILLLSLRVFRHGLCFDQTGLVNTVVKPVGFSLVKGRLRGWPFPFSKSKGGNPLTALADQRETQEGDHPVGGVADLVGQLDALLVGLVLVAVAGAENA